MTLKTTKEQRDLLSSAHLVPGLLSHTMLMGLCHDADRAGELEVENMQDYLDIERALSGQRLLYNRPLASRVADLRAQLDGAYERAARMCEQVDADGEGPDCWDWHAKNYAKAIRALKEQEEV